MTIALSSAYLLVAALAIRATLREVRRLRPKPGEHLQRVELAILRLTGLAAGLGWILLAPVFVHGWVRHRGPRLLGRAQEAGRELRPRLGFRVARGEATSAVERSRRTPVGGTPGGPDPAEAWIYDICAGRS